MSIEKQLDVSWEDSLEALVFYQQYGSERCWKTAKEVRSIYRRLGSEIARLEAVKVRSTIYGAILSLSFDFYCIIWPFLLVVPIQEQILMRHLGLGWEDAYHPWSLE